MKVPSDEELEELAAGVGGALLSGLPQVSETHDVSFEIDLLTEEITPKEVVTESLLNLVKDASETFFDDLENTFEIKKKDIKSIVIRIEGRDGGGYNISGKLDLYR